MQRGKLDSPMSGGHIMAFVSASAHVVRALQRLEGAVELGNMRFSRNKAMFHSVLRDNCVNKLVPLDVISKMQL